MSLKSRANKALIEAGLRVSVEIASATSLTVNERWYDNQHCPRGRATSAWHTDGEREVESSRELESPRGYFAGGGESMSIIKNATFAFEVRGGRSPNGCEYRTIDRVVVWPGCNVSRLRAAVDNVVPVLTLAAFAK